MPSATRTRSWVFTLNNPPREDLPNDWYQAGDVVFVTWQLERSASGTPHLQGYFVTKEVNGNKPTPTWVKNNINGKMHFQARKGTHQQAVDYANKESTRVRGPWTLGEWLDQTTQREQLGERRVKTTLTDVKDDIDKGATEQELWGKHFGSMLRYKNSFRDYRMSTQMGQRVQPYVIVLWGEPGCGKTMKAQQLADTNGGAYWWASHNGVWFDGYDPIAHKVVVFDDFKGNLPYALLLRLLDRYPLQVEVKGSMTAFNPDLIIITSNDDPKDWYFKKPAEGPLEGHLVHKDSTALLRRVAAPYGKTIKMEKDPEFGDPQGIEGRPPLEDVEEAILNGCFDPRPQQQQVKLEVPQEDDFPDTPEPVFRRPSQQDVRDLRTEEELSDTSSEGFADDNAHIDIRKPTKLRRTDSFTFKKPDTTGRFKKLGTQPVQSTLEFLKKEFKKPRPSDDDDGDE